MCIHKLFIIFILIFTIYNVDSAKILGIFHMPSRSHHILGSRLLRGLAEKGHEVTMVSPYPFKEKIKNYRDIFLKELLPFKQDILQNMMRHNITLSDKLKSSGMFRDLSELVLSHNKIQKLKNEHFDLIIQYPMFSDCFLGLAYHFKAPVIYMSTVGSFPFFDIITGNTAPPSYVPAFMLPYPQEMTFFQRVINSLTVWFYYGVLSYLIDTQEQQLLTKYFPEAPSLQELRSNVSLVFLNSHYSIEGARPYVPNMVPVGGLHIEEPKELPQDLKKYLDGATEGAIFFSLGSNVKLASLPEDKVETIIKVLGNLSMKVLFKTDQELSNLPKNIKTGKWLPQNDILAHSNIKLFISHGGLLSTLEAVYHGVPIIGIPIFGDQTSNVANAEVNGYAIKVELNELNEESFSKAIQESLTNSKYKENIKLKSALIKGDIIKPLDKAIYWVEHVLKYKGANHLKNAGSKLPLYQYLLLDVIAFVLLIFVTVIFLLYKIVKIIFKIMISFVVKFFKKKVE